MPDQMKLKKAVFLKLPNFEGLLKAPTPGQMGHLLLRCAANTVAGIHAQVCTVEKWKIFV